MNSKEQYVEVKDSDILRFEEIVVDVSDKEDVRSRVVLSALAPLIGAFEGNKELEDGEEETPIEEGYVDCFLQIFDHIESEFTILNVYKR